MVKKYSIDKNELDNLLHAMKQVCSSGPSTQDVAIKALRKMGKEFENKISDFNEKEEEKDVFVPTHINVVDGSKIQVLDTTLDASIHFPSSIRYVTWRKSLHEQKYTLQDNDFSMLYIPIDKNIPIVNIEKSIKYNAIKFDGTKKCMDYIEKWISLVSNGIFRVDHSKFNSVNDVINSSKEEILNLWIKNDSKKETKVVTYGDYIVNENGKISVVSLYDIGSHPYKIIIEKNGA